MPDPAIALDVAQLVAEVRAVRAGQARIEAALARVLGRHAAPPLSGADLACLRRLLPAAGAIFGGDSFLARDLKHTSALRSVIGRRSVGALALLLRRGEGHDVDGYLLVPSGRELRTQLWRIESIVASRYSDAPLAGAPSD